MTFTQFNDVFLSKLRIRPAIHRSYSSNQLVKVNKIKAPRTANQVIARNPIWTGRGLPAESDRTKFVVEFTEINKEVLDALA